MSHVFLYTPHLLPFSHPLHITPSCLSCGELYNIIIICLSFSWTQSRIVADNLTGYILTCSSLLEGTPSPDPLVIGPTATTANVTELLSGVTYSCEIITLTSEGRSQPRTLNSTTVETGQFGPNSYECFLFSTCSMTLCL